MRIFERVETRPKSSSTTLSKKQDREPTLTPATIVATGLAAATAAIITSSFGVAGTLIGAVLTPVIITAASAIYKVYIESASSKVRDIPNTVRIPPNDVLGRFQAALGRFSSLPRFRRRSILIGALVAGVASLLLGLGTITAIELGMGKNLSCWVWNECPAESSSDGAKGSSTRPSIFGGGQSASSSSSSTAPVNPFGFQQQPTTAAPGASKSPWQTPPPGVPYSDIPSYVPYSQAPDVQPGQRVGPSGGSAEDQQQSPQQRNASGGSQDQQPTPSE